MADLVELLEVAHFVEFFEFFLALDLEFVDESRPFAKLALFHFGGRQHADVEALVLFGLARVSCAQRLHEICYSRKDESLLVVHLRSRSLLLVQLYLLSYALHWILNIKLTEANVGQFGPALVHLIRSVIIGRLQIHIAIRVNLVKVVTGFDVLICSIYLLLLPLNLLCFLLQNSGVPLGACFTR